MCLLIGAAALNVSPRLLGASPDSVPPLPAPTGTVVNVSTETQLQNAVNAALPGATIVIAPGTYNLTSTLYLHVNDLTLRGATNNRNDVILVGRGMTNGNYGAVRFGVWTNAQRITIANLTIRDVYEHHVILNPGAESPRIYNVRLVDAGSQFIKATPDSAGGGVDNGRIDYSVLEHATAAPDSNTSGVDVRAGSGWVVSHNFFRNFRAPGGQLAGPALLFRGGSSNALIESNTFVSCQREIALGLEAASPDDNTGGIVRNNFIYRPASMSAGSAISVGDSPNSQVLHNTVLVNGTYATPIEYRFPDTTRVVIRNNLLDGSIRSGDGASGTVSANYTSAAASMFVNPAAGDLHLRPTATAVIDGVTALSKASTDWDGEPRVQGSAADFGADEVASPTSSANEVLTVFDTTPAATTEAAAVTLAATTLPSPWKAASIGNPAVIGSAAYSSSTFTVRGAGADIYGTSDQFHFAYRTLAGNGEIIARVASLQNTNDGAKAGVMIRESLAAASRHAFVAITPAKGLIFERRVTSGGSTARTSDGLGTAPKWVRLVRSGSTFSAYRSTTGTSWTLMGRQTISMTSTVYVGLAVGSHNASTLTTATFTNVAVVTAATSNAPPSVSLTSPTSSAKFTAPGSINVTASASDSDGTIASVKFYAGSKLVGSDASSPYGIMWSNVPAGRYILTAVAEDDDGASRTSASVSIVVGTSISLPRLLVFRASADHASKVTSYRMDIFRAGANPSTARPERTQNLGKPTVVNGDITVDIAALVQALPSGSYFATVTAIGAGGSSRSSPSPTLVR